MVGDIPILSSPFLALINGAKSELGDDLSRTARVGVSSSCRAAAMRWEGADEKLAKMVSEAVLDNALERRRIREAFKDVQLGINHCLLKTQYTGVIMKESYEVNSKGLEIFSKSWLPSNAPIKALVCFCHGYGDTCTFFFEGIAKKLASSAYGVFALDYPGFGLSEGLHGYISSFDSLVDDVIEHFSKIKENPEYQGLPSFLFGQSMGGAVALKVHFKQPHAWDGAFFVAPMCKMAENVVPPWLVQHTLICIAEILPREKIVPQKDLTEMAFKDLKKREQTSYNVIAKPRLRTALELLKTTNEIEQRLEEIPLCHISEPVYKTSVNWIAQKPAEALGDFVFWCLDVILADLSSHQSTSKGLKKSVQQSSSKAQVAIFVVLALTLRKKPDILISLLPKLTENTKYQGHERLTVIAWIIAQAAQGDLVVGMYCWAHYLLPTVYEKSSVNPQSRDLALQLVDRILSGPKARPILINGSVRKGERLVPPSALDLLMRATFPSPSARVKATEHFEEVYPTLKELALAGSPGTKTTKQASQQLLPSVVKAMQENNPELTKEATDIFIWCLTQNGDCYKQWEKFHLDNVDVSIAVLRTLSDGWKKYSAKLVPLDALREALQHFRAKNEEALSSKASEASYHASIKDADRYCKVMLGRLQRRSSCMKGAVCVLALAVALGFFMSPNMEPWDRKRLHAMLSSLQSF